MLFIAEVTLLLISDFPLQKSAASLCFKNSTYYVRLKSKRNTRYILRISSFWKWFTEGNNEGEKWNLSIPASLGKFVDKPAMFYSLLALHANSKSKHPKIKKCAEIIFHILIL